MKLLLLFAGSVLIGCGLIFGFVHGLVPHLVTPQFFPEARAGEPPAPSAYQTLASAGQAVQEGAGRPAGERLAGTR